MRNGVWVKVPGWLRIALTGLLLGVLFGWALPRYIDYGAVWDSITALDAAQVAVLALLGLLWTAVDSLVFTYAIPGLGLVAGYRAWLASNAVAGFVPSPLDLAIRLGIYASHGVDVTVAASGVLLSGIVTTTVKLSAATAALVALTATGGISGAVRTIAVAAATALVAGGVVVVAGLRSPSVAAGAGRAVERVYNVVVRRLARREASGFADQALAVRSELLSTARYRWQVIVAAALTSQALLFTALVLSMRFVGVPASVVGLADLLVAYALGIVATLLPWLRSGLGASELVYLLVLDQRATTAAADQIAAGAFTQRVFTWVIPVFFGLVVLVDWLRTRSMR